MAEVRQGSRIRFTIPDAQKRTVPARVEKAHSQSEVALSFYHPDERERVSIDSVHRAEKPAPGCWHFPADEDPEPVDEPEDGAAE